MIREVFFITVLTHTFLLVFALCRTWAKTIPGKVEFFSSEGSDPTIPIPVVALQNVDDSYPPQKKSFMMLKYMHDHYLDQFEWFMRADDDVYIKSEKLESFLRSLNSSEAIFLGQTGMGARDELGKLALEPGENFCMGGPGVIMSREVLRRMVPHIRQCLQEMYTTHEDVEVGRCVRRFAGVQCVWSYEVRTCNTPGYACKITGPNDGDPVTICIIISVLYFLQLRFEVSNAYCLKSASSLNSQSCNFPVLEIIGCSESEKHAFFSPSNLPDGFDPSKGFTDTWAGITERASAVQGWGV